MNKVGKAVIGHLRKHGETCAARHPLNPRQQLTMTDAIHTLGKMVNSYLSSQAARILWTKLKQSMCPSQLGALPNQWLELMTQMALRNTQAIGEIAQRILDHPAPITRQQRTTLVTCRLLALVQKNAFKAAKKLWVDNAGRIDSKASKSLRFRLLLAHSSKQSFLPRTASP